MILDEIVSKTKERIEKQKKEKPLETLKEQINTIEENSFPFEETLKKDDLSFICEVKKASPSKGLICENFNPIEIAKEYESIGASAVSVLTEPHFFQGKNSYLQDIAENINIPILRKDFVIDEYMIYEAKTLNASAILLIASILTENQLKEYINLATSLGLSALVEAHDKNEITKSLNAGARIIGVNNRNLKNFTVDINNSINLRKHVPNDILFISESGIKTNKDIINLRNNNVNGVLIGETLMKADNKKNTLDELKKT